MVTDSSSERVSAGLTTRASVRRSTCVKAVSGLVTWTQFIASEGEHRGEHPLRARCSPLIGPRRGYVLVNERDSRAASPQGNCRSSCRLQAVVVGRRSVPPAWWRHCRSGRQQQSRGVSDHPKWPLGLPSLRPAMWSLTPPLKGCWRPVPARVSPAGSRGEFDAQSARELDGFLDALFTLVPAFGLERLTPRGGPRQRAVVGVVRER